MARPRGSSPRSRGRPKKGVVRDDDFVLMRRRTTQEGARTGWSIVWNDEADWAPYFDAGWLLAHVTEAILRAHVAAISTGQKASGGSQPPLDPDGQQARIAKKGKRPSFRGKNKHDSKSKGTMLHELLTRGKVKSSGAIVSRSNKAGTGRGGTRATTTIHPGHGLHTVFLQQEAGARARRGKLTDTPTEYLYVEGEIVSLVDAALTEWLDIAADGPPDLDSLNFDPILGRDI